MRRIIITISVAIVACIDNANCFVPSIPSTFRASSQKSSSTSIYSSSPPSPPPTPDPGTHEELMYTLGVNLARQLGDIRPLVENPSELAVVAQGLLDVVIGRLNEEGQKEFLTRRAKDLNKLVTERADSIRKKIESAGKSMLEEMSQTEGTISLDSGVVVHLLEPDESGEFGNGQHPTVGSTVKVHYHGTLPDGTVFDSSIKRGEPAVFALGQVIPGWKEALQVIHEGETAMIGIPPEMGYGQEGTPDGRIPGGATLFFKVQLLEVLTGGMGGKPQLLGADGKSIKKKSGSSGLLGPDGNPL